MIQLIKHLSSITKLHGAADLDSLLLDVPFIAHLKDRKSTYISCNQSTLSVCGFSNENEMIGLSDLDLNFISNDEAESFRKADAIVMKMGEPRTFIDHFHTHDGIPVVSMSHKSPLRLRSKKIVGIKSYTIIINKKNNALVSLSMIKKEENPYLLTDRQISCLVNLIKGMSVKQIAQHLDLSPRTVEHYLDAIKNKMKCNTRHELISKSLKLQVIKNNLAF